MAHFTLLVLAGTMAVDYGWTAQPNGQLEYIIQIEPALVEGLHQGEQVVSEIHPDARGVTRFRIQVGDQPLPRTAHREVEPEPVSDPSDSTTGQIEPTMSTSLPRLERPRDMEDPAEYIRPARDESGFTRWTRKNQPPDLPTDRSKGTSRFTPTFEDQSDTEHIADRHGPGFEPAVIPDERPSAAPHDATVAALIERPLPLVADAATSAFIPADPLPVPAEKERFESAATESEPGTFGLPHSLREPAASQPISDKSDKPAQANQQTPPTDIPLRTTPSRPWLPLSFALLGLFASIGSNVYLGWIAWGVHARYRNLASQIDCPTGSA